ncbi:hypothetical protein RDI58_028006 [Solanum bulbocastanum]|uniref:60S ribosomal protein L29 n=1 Tax=Solanum bulbocastanum TaxID=147425 RepID=A0AAN8Y0Q0_SOLBU
MESRNPGSIVTVPPKGSVKKPNMDPKFLRNQRYARKHNPKTVESAEK